MEIQKTDVIKIISIIQANYAYAYKDTSKTNLSIMADTWYNSLKVYPKEVILKVVQFTLESSTYPPTLADILNNLKHLIKLSLPSENHLWNEIIDAVHKAINFYYYGEQYCVNGKKPKERLQIVFDNMHEICRLWLGNVDTLVNMRLLDTTALSCEKARFCKDLPLLVENVCLHYCCLPTMLVDIVENQLPQRVANNTNTKGTLPILAESEEQKWKN